METNRARKPNPQLKRAMGLLFVTCAVVLTLILKLVIAVKFAIPISLLLLSVILYPIYIRGRENKWTKDKRPWTWQAYALVVVLYNFILFGVLILIFP